MFVSSYFYKNARTLRQIQMIGAVMWMAYGVLVHAAPVFVANLLVLSAAAWSMLRPSHVSRLKPQA